MKKILFDTDTWLYLSAVFVVSVFVQKDTNWSEYLWVLILNLLSILPLVGYRASKLIRATQPREKGQISWQILVFLLYPVVSTLVTDLDNKSVMEYPPYLLTLYLALIYKLVFRIAELLKGQEKDPSIKINLDTAMLTIFMFISVYLALMIGSDLNSWSASNNLANSLNWTSIYENWLLTLWIAVQLFLLFFIGYIFYWLNAKLLVRHVLISKGLIYYLIVSFGVVCVLYPVLTELYLLLPINYMGEPIIPAVDANAFDWANGRVFFAVIVISMPFVVVSLWHEDNRKLILAEKEYQQTELALLKQQIDPHFFFNTLNNLYSLCLKKSEMAPDVVLRLSEIMRYVVYSAKEPYVKLADEIHYLQDYVELQSIRFNQTASIELNIEIDNNDLCIAPLLLVILVENAFKHGLEQSSSNKYLHARLAVKNNKLMFECKNSIVSATANGPIIEGIGLSNLRRRLVLTYPEHHHFEIVTSEAEFIAKLTLHLSQERL